MIESFGLQVIFKLVCIILGILCARLSLLWMDKKLVPQEFKEFIGNASGLEKSVYYGMRFIGICLMVGLALS